MSLLRLAVARRGLSTSARTRAAGADLFGAEFRAEREKVQHHAAGSAELWRKITLYAAIPLIVVFGLHIKNVEAEHAAHRAHLIEENGGTAPEKRIYPYINMRVKDFPWGPQSLFFNPHVNTPAGSE